MYLLLPLIAALAFALGSIVFKRAYQEGAGVVHAVVVNNVVLGIAFLPLLAIDQKSVPWDLWYLPVLTSLTFVTGHLLNVLSLRVGDVSVATPLLGAKVTFVALLAWAVFGTRLDAIQWIAAGLTTLGVLVMGRTDLKRGRRMGITTILALGCALAFAFTDVMIQSWAARFGVWNFLSLVFAALAVLSLAMLPVFGRESLRAPRNAWFWIFAAAGLSGMQAILITGTIGIWKDAAGVNVVYATRGILSIVLVWFLGARLKNTERQSAGPAAMAWRFAGATLILAAVALAVKGSRH
ncbi:MAG: DMT family transporter [Verrucomicrobiales bacterium]|nr:DMT family transporter [Verrucomicrobiales bacterium]